jgi:low temperature requirement protein LtrA
VTTEAQAVGPRVSTLELFFDLVFVFIVTQIAHLVHAGHSAVDLVRVFFVLAAIWWMYAGYSWLTNNIGTRRPSQRLLMLLAMAGFLVMALRVPELGERHGVAFGLAYLFVVLVHAALFAHAVGRAILAILPFNLALAAMAVLSGLLAPEWNWAPWAGAGFAIFASTLARRESGFRLEPGHFVERHGLVVLIAIGESVVAIGAGAAALPPGLALGAVVVLGLGLAAGIWWCYFDGDAERAEHALAAASPERRSRLAITAFYHAHLVMLLGIIGAAAGVHDAVAGLGGASSAAASWLLAGGVAIYLGGHALFRRLLGIGRARGRLVAAALALPAVLIGRAAGSVWQLAFLVALLAVLALVDRNVTVRSARSAR